MWWHDAIIDKMLENPHWSKKEIALQLRCSAQFVYMITNSDLFVARWEQRRNQHSENLGIALLGKAQKVAERTLDRILDQLEDSGKQIPLGQLETLADKTLGRLGYGPKAPPLSAAAMVANAETVQVIIPATPDELNAARALILKNERELAAQMIERDRRELPLDARELKVIEGVRSDGVDSFDGGDTDP